MMREALPRWAIDVQPDPIGVHTWSILCGLAMLRRRRCVSLRYRDVGAPTGPGTWLRVRDVQSGAIRTIYVDTSDGEVPGGLVRAAIAGAVWKRSWTPGSGRPLGLVAGMRSGHERVASYVTASARTALKHRRGDELRRVASFVARRSLPSLIGDYQRPSQRHSTVLYQVRAWAPGATALDETRDAVNDGRADVIEALQRHFGARFRGGFLPTDFARRRYPGLMTEQPVSQAEYAALIRSSAVGVSTIGLHGSNPWKLAEYLAGGVAIVSEPLRYPLPETLDVAFWFTTPNECVAQCDALLSSGYLVAGARSEAFWREYVRPDQLILRRLIEEFG